ncbi:hypothetical protein WME76_22725 [Sorangium sp. So ce119]|uniref:hypothetical protein n=1 Tax=Sorangium sp. So ce119 TaxID=3133279 RepID=UPI003F5E1043
MLFDNGWYSVIAGEYEGEYAIGERWNGDDDKPGFPHQGGHPLWHVVPDFLRSAVLTGLQDELARTASDDNREQADAVSRELERLRHLKQ